jgi:hypothetical protein
MSIFDRLKRPLDTDTPATPATLRPKPPPTVATVSVSSGVFPTATVGADIEERAAIIEHDGRVPRFLADALAQLEACACPTVRESIRLREVTNAFARMLDDGSAALALTEGWELRDLIGTDMGHASSEHFNGLAFSLSGRDRVREVEPDRAVIETRSGRTHTWIRVPLPTSVRLPWEPSGPRASREGRAS